jgi:hypothetical protein
VYALSNSFAKYQHILPFGLVEFRTSAPVAVYHWLMVFLTEKISARLFQISFAFTGGKGKSRCERAVCIKNQNESPPLGIFEK